MRHFDLPFPGIDVRSVPQIIKLIDACHFHVIAAERRIDPVKIRTELSVFDIDAAYSKIAAAFHDLVQRLRPPCLIDRLCNVIIKYRQPDRVGILLLQRHLHCRAVKRSALSPHLRTPVHRIGEDLLDLGHMIDRIRLMPRLEIKDPALPALEGTTAAKHLAARKPAREHHVIGLWNVKILAVHLLDRNVKVRRNPLRDRVPGRCRKQALAIPMPPAERHARPQQADHNLGKMRRVQRDQPHALQHMALHALRHLVRKRVVCPMPPVDQHIRVREHLLGQTVLRLRQRRRAHEKIPVRAQKIRNTPMDPLRIDLPHFLLSLLMQIFIPYSYLDHLFPPPV